MGFASAVCFAVATIMATSLLRETAALAIDSTMSSAINAFNRKIYIYLGYPDPAQYESLVYSPLSLHVILTMLNQRENGHTKDVVDSVLGINTNQQFDDYLAALDVTNKTVIPDGFLGSANAIFDENPNKFDAGFINTIKEKFGVQEIVVDTSDLGSVQMTLNKWVGDKSDQTLNKGLELMKQKKFFDTHKGESGILGNVLYLQSQWKEAFTTEETGTFNLMNKANEKVTCTFLSLTSNFKIFHSDKLNAKVLEIPLYNEAIAMYFILSDNPNEQLSKLELNMAMHEISLEEIVDSFKDISPEEVTVKIPQFKIESSLDIRTPLILSFYFDKPKEEAVIGEYLLKVPSVAFNYFLDLTKSGIKVATTTEMIISSTLVEGTLGAGRPGQRKEVSAPGETNVSPNGEGFSFDKPFPYFIYHKESRNLLFRGKLTNPLN